MEEVDEILETISLSIATAVVARKRRKKRRRRSVWIKSWIATRETQGAFHCLLKDLESDPEHFLNYLRLDLAIFEQLVEKLNPILKKKDTCMRNAITPSEQLAVTLRFLATGESYTSLQYQFRINKGTLSLIIPKVCKSLSVVLSDVIACPNTANEWLEISNCFQWRWQLPNCLGAIDGKHVRILHPPHSGSDYFNYKGYFSLVLMAVVGPNSEFLFADVGCQGRISDGGVLRNTVFYKALQSHKLQIPESKPLPVTESMIVEDWCPILPHYFVGDDAFSLTPNIMKPYPKRGLTEEQRIFNYRLSRARRVSENAFGILSAKFRVFHTTLCVKPENAISIVHACLALHNFLIKKYPSVYIPSGSLDYEKDGEVIGGDWRQNGDSNFETLVAPGMNHTRNASQVRNVLSEYVNGPGQVPWQWKVLSV